MTGMVSLAPGTRHDSAGASACPASSPGGTPAVLLRLGGAGLPLPVGLRAPGPGGGDAVDLRRADDGGIRLVARGDRRRGVAGRRAGGRGRAAARTDPRPPRRAADALPCRAGHRAFVHGAVAHAVAGGLLPAVLLCPHDLGGAVRARPLRRAEQLVRDPTHARHLDRHAVPDVGAGRHAADRPDTPCATATGARGWVAIGATVLVVGFVPTWALAGAPAGRSRSCAGRAWSPAPRRRRRRNPPTRAHQAMRTRAFWLLSLFTVLVYPVQAGVSLHQAPHLIERGFSPTLAATVISVFSAMSAVASFSVGFLPRRWPIRSVMVVAALAMASARSCLIGVGTRGERLLRCRPVRCRHRRHHDVAAGGLGGLFRPGRATARSAAWR